MTLRRTAALATVAASSAAMGCGGSSTEPVDKPSASKPTASITTAQRAPGGGVRAVEEFWRFVQIGAVPAAIETYDARVVRAVGLGDFAGTLATQTPTIERTRLNPLTADRVAGGLLVIAEALPATGVKSRYSFFLVRREGRYRIVYDTFASAALQAFAQGALQRSIDASPAEPSTKAIAAGDAAISRYRLAALTALASDKAKARAAESAREKAKSRKSRSANAG